VLQILAKIKPNQKPTVCIVSATRTNAVTTFLQKHIKSKTATIETVATDDAHRTNHKLQEVFVPCKGQRSAVVLNDVLAADPPDGDSKTLIFTNTVERCKQVYDDLLAKGMKVQALHGELKPRVRNKAIMDFKSKDNILVSTNLASRGLDFDKLDHVILYDFPYNPADYLHRVGRTARAGLEGKVTTLVRKRNFPLVEQIHKLQTAKKPITVRDVSKPMAQVATEEKFRQGLSRIKKRKRVINLRYWKKKFGIPPRDHLGSPYKKLLRKQVKRRLKAVKQLFILRKRGRLAKDQLIPTIPNPVVESTETQTISTMVQAKDGKLQVQAVRRRNKLDDEEDIQKQLEKGEKLEKLLYRTKGVRGRKNFL